MSSLKGSVGEHAFALECLKRGLVVSWPTATHLAYDLIVSSPRRDYRVQIKGVTKPHQGRTYRVTTHHNNRLYDPELVAYIVIWLADRNKWYIIPSAEIKTKTIYLKPDSACRWNTFSGAWDEIK